MPRRILVVLAATAISLVVGGVALAGAHSDSRHSPKASAAAASMCGTLTKAPTIKHVIVLFMENQPYSTIQSSSSTPYIHSLESACGLATNYHNITHPSLPEYLAATDGGTLKQVTTPYVNDCTPGAGCPQTGLNNIFAQVNAHKKVWKSYEESMPSNCDKSNAGFYAPRHNPAVYYSDLANCNTQDIPLGTLSNSALLQNFQSESTAPAYSWITPNLCDDMHGASGCPSTSELAQGDNWLKQWIPKLTSTPVYKSGDTVLFLTWDEGENGDVPAGGSCAAAPSDPSCHVVMIVIAPSVKKGKRVSISFNHYSLLKSSEDLLGYAELNQAKTAASMVTPFGL